MLARHAPVDADEQAGALELPALLSIVGIGLISAGEHGNEQVQQHLQEGPSMRKREKK